MIDPRTGSGRMVLAQDEIDAFQAGGSLVMDDRRRRPLYFDGRFLAARDLVREQAYFLTRQADIARSAGFGAMQGLMVRSASAADTVTIFSGQGITPSGELVIIPANHTISLSNVPEDQKLNTNFGLMPIPKEPFRNRTGLYVLGLRAVEFSANPVTSYPTTISGPRTVHDGDIVEATAITLVPYPDSATSIELSARRSFVAREIFFSGTLRGVPSAVLPVAMIALNHGNVEWIDSYMVRRELGAEYGDLLRFRTGTRATQQAFILQYDAQLNDVLSQRQHGGLGFSFAATQYFYALPPCGRLPMACIDTENFTQSFFPQETDVRLSIAPDDELPSLIEQAVGLPPIDLAQPAESFQNISVMMLVPVPRQQFAQIKSKLETIPLQPVVPTAIAARAPLDLLRLRRGPLPVDPVVMPPTATANALWKDIVATPFAYYIRMRSAPESVDITTEPQSAPQPIESQPTPPPVDANPTPQPPPPTPGTSVPPQTPEPTPPTPGTSVPPTPTPEPTPATPVPPSTPTTPLPQPGTSVPPTQPAIPPSEPTPLPEQPKRPPLEPPPTPRVPDPTKPSKPEPPPEPPKPARPLRPSAPEPPKPPTPKPPVPPRPLRPISPPAPKPTPLRPGPVKPRVKIP